MIVELTRDQEGVELVTATLNRLNIDAEPVYVCLSLGQATYKNKKYSVMVDWTGGTMTTEENK